MGKATKPSRLKEGIIKNYNVSEEEYRIIFNSFFSCSSRKQSTYKFAFFKSILDNLNNVEISENGAFISYSNIFDNFPKYYWPLVIENMLFQINDHHVYSNTRIESLILEEIHKTPSLATTSYNSLDPKFIKILSQKAKEQCSACVIGALYDEFKGVVYSFNKRGTGITLAPKAYSFLKENQFTMQQQNDMAWAEFLLTLNPSMPLKDIISILQ